MALTMELSLRLGETLSLEELRFLGEGVISRRMSSLSMGKPLKEIKFNQAMKS